MDQQAGSFTYRQGVAQDNEPSRCIYCHETFKDGDLWIKSTSVDGSLAVAAHTACTVNHDHGDKQQPA